MWRRIWFSILVGVTITTYTFSVAQETTTESFFDTGLPSSAPTAQPLAVTWAPSVNPSYKTTRNPTRFPSTEVVASTAKTYPLGDTQEQSSLMIALLVVFGSSCIIFCVIAILRRREERNGYLLAMRPPKDSGDLSSNTNPHDPNVRKYYASQFFQDGSPVSPRYVQSAIGRRSDSTPYNDPSESLLHSKPNGRVVFSV